MGTGTAGATNIDYTYTAALTMVDGARIHGWRSTCTVAASAEVTSPNNLTTLAIPIIMR